MPGLDTAISDILEEVGIWWPQADPDQLRQAADVWSGLNSQIYETLYALDGTLCQIQEQNSGPAANALSAFWYQHWSGAEGYLASTADACDRLSQALRAYADAVDRANEKLAHLAEELAIALAAAVVTEGLTAAWGVEEAIASGAVIMVDCSAETAAAIGLFGGDFLAGVLVDGAIEMGANLASGKPLLDINAMELLLAGLGGAAGAAVMRGLSEGLSHGAPEVLKGAGDVAGKEFVREGFEPDFPDLPDPDATGLDVPPPDLDESQMENLPDINPHVAPLVQHHADPGMPPPETLQPIHHGDGGAGLHVTPLEVLPAAAAIPAAAAVLRNSRPAAATPPPPPASPLEAEPTVPAGGSVIGGAIAGSPVVTVPARTPPVVQTPATVETDADGIRVTVTDVTTVTVDGANGAAVSVGNTATVDASVPSAAPTPSALHVDGLGAGDVPVGSPAVGSAPAVGGHSAPQMPLAPLPHGSGAIPAQAVIPNGQPGSDAHAPVPPQTSCADPAAPPAGHESHHAGFDPATGMMATTAMMAVNSATSAGRSGVVPPPPDVDYDPYGEAGE